MKLFSSGENQRIQRIVDGDERAFQSLVCDYYPLAYNLACKMLNDRQDAEEVVQDAFVKIREALDSFRGDASLKTWILRIVMRLTLNRRRDRSRSSWNRMGLHKVATVEEEEIADSLRVLQVCTGQQSSEWPTGCLQSMVVQWWAAPSRAATMRGNFTVVCPIAHQDAHLLEHRNAIRS